MNTEILLYTVAAVMITAIIAYLYYQGKLKVLQEKIAQLLSSNEQLNANLENERDRLTSVQQEKQTLQSKLAVEANKNNLLQEQMQADRENQTRQLEQFENIAHKVLKHQAHAFDEHHQKEVKQLLSPLQDQIKRFEDRIERTSHDSNSRLGELKQQIRTLSEKSDQVSQDANNLAKALKGDSKMQGNWGELILESILDKSGLVKDREYFVQQTETTREGRRLRPDVIIDLPEGKKIIIDSKVSLRAYDDMVRATEESEQRKFQKHHYVAVKKHIDDLAAKNYPDIYEAESPDFVLMFIPIDTAFSCVQMYDRDLYQYAFEKNVVIVTPSTLLATLKLVETIWRNDRQNRYALDIAMEAGKMYDKFVGFINDMEKIGKQLNTVNNTYQDSMRKLSHGKGNLISKADNIRQLGAKTTKALATGLVESANAHAHLPG